MVKRAKILVIGPGTALEHEICNLGRALGHQMVSVSEAGRPLKDEPWVSGITWIQQMNIAEDNGLEDKLSDCFAVIVCDHVTSQDLQGDLLAQNAKSLVQKAADAAEQAAASKFVWVRTTELTAGTGARARERSEQSVDRTLIVNCIYKEAEDDLLKRSFRSTIFRPTLIFGQGIPMQLENGSFIDALPLECVAMAALRASLEPDTSGIMERDAIELYGDAMMIQ